MAKSVAFALSSPSYVGIFLVADALMKDESVLATGAAGLEPFCGSDVEDDMLIFRVLLLICCCLMM